MAMNTIDVLGKNRAQLMKKVEIVDLPMKNGGSFHSYVTVYQRVTYTYNMFSRWGYKMLTSYN